MYGSKPTAMQGVDLKGAHLKNANFQGADLTGAQFQGVPIIPSDPSQAAQFQWSLWEIVPARLEEADFRYAVLTLAQFKGCYFYGTKLEGAYIRGADIYEAHLEDVDWGNYKIGEETGEEKRKDFYSAANIYRRLKIWYNNAGRYDIAGNFFYREEEAYRKAYRKLLQKEISHQFQKSKYKEILCFLLERKREVWNLLWLWIFRLLCGYGEKPLRVIGWAASVVLGLTFIYFIVGSIWEWWAFWNSLYFSAVSFTALGYGSWLGMTNDWMRGLGAFESFIGVFTMALFLVTFIRKMIR